MPVVAADIIIYGAANMPENDSTTAGGAIDKTIKILDTDMGDVGGTDTVEVLSDNAGDTTQTVTVTGRDASGLIQSEVFSLAGTTPQNGSQSFERILKIVASATHTGIITVRDASGDVTQATLEGTAAAPGGTAILEARRPFYDATANASGGSDKTFYEKVFVANTNASLALNSAAIELTADGTTNNRVDFDLEGSVNDNNSVTNRLTEPAGADMLGAPTWDDTQKSVPGGSLGDRTTGTSDHIGVWARLFLPAGESPENTNFTLTVTGSST